MMKNTTKIFALVCLLAVSGCSQVKRPEPLTSDELVKPMVVKAGTSVTVRYVANEGVLIASNDKQVLIDGLHREYKPAYLFPPPELQTLLENARPPYDKVTLVLVSHIHLDHFHPASIGLHLRNNRQAVLASSGQAVSEVAKDSSEYETIRSQIRPVTHEWKKWVDMQVDGLKIKFLGLRHSGENFKDIQNLGHVIEIGGKKLLHIGDADMTAENFAPFNLPQENIDIAFIPYWFLISAEGRTFVKEQFNAKQIIAVHIPPAESEQVIKQLKKELPEAIAFTKILEERSF